MSIVEYNLRTIVSICILLIGAIWVLIDSFTKKDRIVGIICVFLILACIFSIFAFISYKDEPIASGSVEDVVNIGSWAGLMDTYQIVIKCNNEKSIKFYTSLFSSRSFKKSVENLKKGEIISVYASNYLNIMYRFDV